MIQKYPQIIDVRSAGKLFVYYALRNWDLQANVIDIRGRNRMEIRRNKSRRRRREEERGDEEAEDG